MDRLDEHVRIGPRQAVQRNAEADQHHDEEPAKHRAGQSQRQGPKAKSGRGIGDSHALLGRRGHHRSGHHAGNHKGYGLVNHDRRIGGNHEGNDAPSHAHPEGKHAGEAAERQRGQRHEPDGMKCQVDVAEQEDAEQDRVDDIHRYGAQRTAGHKAPARIIGQGRDLLSALTGASV